MHAGECRLPSPSALVLALFFLDCLFLEGGGLAFHHSCTQQCSVLCNFCSRFCSEGDCADPPPADGGSQRCFQMGNRFPLVLEGGHIVTDLE